MLIEHESASKCEAIARNAGCGQVCRARFAQADAYTDADGGEVLTYYAAMGCISGEAAPVHHGAPHTIRDLIEGYVGYVEQHRNSAVRKLRP